MLLLLPALALGALVGEAARRVVLGGRYRRPEDEPRLDDARWSPLLGALAFGAVAQTSAALPVGVRVVAHVAAGLLVLLSLVDLDVHRLPDALVRPLAVGLLLAAAAAGAMTSSWAPLLHSLLGGAALYGLFYLLALAPSGFGYGDVKLAGALGLGLGPLGPGAVVTAPLLAMLVGGVVAVGLLLTGRARRSTHLAFGPALALGALLALGA